MMWMIHTLLSLLFPPSCFQCRKQGKTLCDECLRRARKALSSPASFIVAGFDYKDPLIRRSIRALKYYGRRDLAAPLSSELAQMLRTVPEYQSYILVPVPMPLLRKYLRGYNQAELLAAHLAHACSLHSDPSLIRRLKTPERQVRAVNRRARLLNQRGTFISGDAARKRIILIDDVTTTGATLREARRVLLEAGAEDVRALVVAH